MKVVIPTTYVGHEKMVFSTPLSEYKVYDQDIWKEKTSDNPFQVSNIICDGGYTCGQQLLTEVVEIVKKLLFWSFFLIFPILPVWKWTFRDLPPADSQESAGG